MNIKLAWVLPVTVLGLVALASTSPQDAPAPVDFRPFTDARNWIVKEPMTYKVGVSRESVTVPRGFVTDFASIPGVLQGLIQVNSPNLLPAVVHDYLYWRQACTRDQADQIMRLAMIENGVAAWQRFSIYEAVQWGGEDAWVENKSQRDKGLVRILPESHIAIGAQTLWPAYQQRLAAAHIANGPDGRITSGLCARGSMETSEALTTP